MFRRTCTVVALVSVAVFSAACDDKISNNLVAISANTTRVRFVNATNNVFDITLDGVVGTGNATIGFGQSSSCISISSAAPALAVDLAGTTTLVNGFVPAFTLGGSFTVVASTDASGATVFTTLDNAFATPSGQSGARAFNAVAGTTYDAFINAVGGALGTPVASAIPFASASNFFDVAPGTNEVTFTNTGSLVPVGAAADLTFNANTNYLITVGPAAPATTGARTFLVPNC